MTTSVKAAKGKLNEHGLPLQWDHTLGLYLDISRKDTGYACMLGDELIHHGHKGFAHLKNDGEMLHAYREWLHKLLDAGEFDLIGVEWAPFQKGRALELWHGMLAITKLVREEFDLKMIGVHPVQVKIAASHRHDAPKKEVIRGVNWKYDLKLENDNIADAIGVGLAIPDILDGVYKIKWL